MQLIILVTLLILAPVTMSTATQDGSAIQQNMGPMMQMMRNCPASLESVKFAVADTATGIALTITTESGNVDELRQGLERMAAMHSPNGEKPSMMRHRMIAGSIQFEEVEGGAKLTLTPVDPSQLDAFRKQVREHVERMQKGDCSMMQGMMRGMHQQETAPAEYGHDPHHPE
jgi:hypothetical protein